MARFRTNRHLLAVACLAAGTAGCLRKPDTTHQASTNEISVSFGDKAIDPLRRTHILIVGHSEEVENRLMNVATGMVFRLKEIHPGDQIVLLRNSATAEIRHLDDTLAREQVKLLAYTDAALTTQRFLSYAEQFKAIASVTVLSHSSPWGLELDLKEERASYFNIFDKSGAERLRGHFTPDAYVSLMGCNAGFDFAPFLVKAWGVPVIAGLTSSYFQRLHEDGNWYYSTQGPYPSPRWAPQNRLSYRVPMSCEDGKCFRLKPINTPYKGKWGDFSAGGLPFYKAFCDVNGVGRLPRCEERMALSLMAWPSVVAVGPSSSPEQFDALAIDFLCPLVPGTDLRERCAQQLKSGTPSPQHPYGGRLLSCDFERCRFRFEFTTTDGLPDLASARLHVPPDAPVEGIAVFQREFAAYREGFARLKQQGSVSPRQ